MTASPVVTPTPGVTPVPNADAVGTTKGPANQPPNGVASAVQATSAPGKIVAPGTPALSPLSPASGFSMPGRPIGAAAADQRPY